MWVTARFPFEWGPEQPQDWFHEFIRTLWGWGDVLNCICWRQRADNNNIKKPIHYWVIQPFHRRVVGFKGRRPRLTNQHAFRLDSTAICIWYILNYKCIFSDTDLELNRNAMTPIKRLWRGWEKNRVQKRGNRRECDSEGKASQESITLSLKQSH